MSGTKKGGFFSKLKKAAMKVMGITKKKKKKKKTPKPGQVDYNARGAEKTRRQIQKMTIEKINS